MDGDFRIDLEEVLKNIDSAEVISIYFPLLRKTILIDTRFTEEGFPPGYRTASDLNAILSVRWARP